MSRIKLSSPVRPSVRPSKTAGKRTLSSYASFVLFVAAAAIALSAMVVRVGRNRMTQSPEETLRQTPGRTASTSAAASEEQQQKNTSAAPGTTEVGQKQTRTTTHREDPEKAGKLPDSDEWEDSEQTAAIQVMGNSRSYVRPSGGAVIKPCSLKQLAYSRTMKDWRVHNGLDLAAEKGEIVRSAGEGKVTDITHDALYGTTVVVNQNDGLMVYYRGLNKDTAVRQGENIAEGATIGTVGELPCEAADGTHLHIEVRSENKFLDPAQALGIQ